MSWYKISKQKEFPQIANQFPSKEEQTMAFFDRNEEAIRDVIEEYQASKPGEIQPWPVVPFDRVNKIWKDYMRYRVVHDTRGMEQISDRMIKNVHRLYANTYLSGHTPHDPSYELDNYGMSEKDLKRFYDEYTLDEYGQDRISDYALDDLQNDALELSRANTAEEKLQIVDRMFSRIHRRSDLPAMFIEGGTKSLNMLFGRPTEAFNLKQYKIGSRKMYDKRNYANRRNERIYFLPPPLKTTL